ncbi:hypothetical protein Pve01_42080 [Planomonospora venezuelensis]|uniref:Uncharacterized protein n=2 Tax=Planomonospora venezuelensis TaxID=1999 RepID=A0A841D7V6_PLAVE|nr:hypothetical protein [Planomonospora venezuelensis]GIN02550.1 hypothetical protein Pve01_42080 [Planomonospora venezuelensis]
MRWWFGAFGMSVLAPVLYVVLREAATHHFAVCAVLNSGVRSWPSESSSAVLQWWRELNVFGGVPAEIMWFPPVLMVIGGLAVALAGRTPGAVIGGVVTVPVGLLSACLLMESLSHLETTAATCGMWIALGEVSVSLALALSYGIATGMAVRGTIAFRTTDRRPQ